MVCIFGGSPGDGRSHTGRVLHPGGRTGESLGEGARVPHQLGAGGPLLLPQKCGTGPDDPPAVHSRLPVLLAGSGPV